MADGIAEERLRSRFGGPVGVLFGEQPSLSVQTASSLGQTY
jgi:hypothetical protein